MAIFFWTFLSIFAHANYYIQSCNPSTANIEFTSNPDGLSHAERLALLNYAASSYQAINSALWNNSSPSGCLKEQIKLIDSALDKIPCTSGTVYRGTKKYFPVVQGQEYPTPLKGFTSTSMSRDIAEGFIKDRFEVLNITCGKDISAYSGTVSSGQSEREILLPRNTRLQATRVQSKYMNIFSEATGSMESRLVEVVVARQLGNSGTLASPQSPAGGFQ